MKDNSIELQRIVLRLKIEKYILLDLWLDYSPEIRGDVYIYGAGVVGKLLSRCFKNRPKAFIDKKKELHDINGVPVICLDECQATLFRKGDTIIVTPIWAFDEIKEKLLNICPDVNVLSIEKLMEDM